jgi:hypothetical protein
VCRDAGGRGARLLQRTAALDSTFVRLSATLSPWSVHGGFALGVRLQGLVALGRAFPDRPRLTLLADVNDHTALLERDLASWCGWRLRVALGEDGHRSFARSTWLDHLATIFIVEFITDD